MILPTITWGEARAIYEMSLEQPYGTEIEDNILDNSEMMDASEGKADDEYVYPEEAEAFLAATEEPEPITAALAPDAPSPLYFTVDENDNVLELVKEEEDPDGTFVRMEGEWIDISKEEEFPTIDDQFIHYANDESVSAWDSELESNENLKLSDVQSYIIK